MHVTPRKYICCVTMSVTSLKLGQRGRGLQDKQPVAEVYWQLLQSMYEESPAHNNWAVGQAKQIHRQYVHTQVPTQQQSNSRQSSTNSDIWSCWQRAEENTQCIILKWKKMCLLCVILFSWTEWRVKAVWGDQRVEKHLKIRLESDFKGTERKGRKRFWSWLIETES